MIRIGPQDRVFILTGAGISAESGIPTFRGAGGLWEGHRIEEVASPIAWARDPEMVWKFYSWRREKARACHPNPAHAALAALESVIGDRLYLCTQNVDDLHERSGSKRVIHMHGELFKSRCDRAACSSDPFVDTKSYPSRDAIARCSCGGAIRPHIVWFGEVPFLLEEIFRELERATIFVTVGSSGVVEPAASFAGAARTGTPARTVYVGPEAPANRELFDDFYSGPAGEVLPKLFQTA